MQLTSGTPELSKTEIDYDMLRNVKAGRTQKVRVHCKDSANQPAVPGRNVTIGVTLTSALTKLEPDAWKVHPSEQLERSVIGDALEISFAPRLAGEVKAYFWADIDTEMFSASPGSQSRRASRSPGRRGSVSPKGRNRRSSKSPPYNPSEDTRKLLPGSPFLMTIFPAEVSVKHSYIDGVQLQVYGQWEDAPDVLVSGKIKKRSTSPVRSEEDGAEGGGAEENNESAENALQVGDSIKIRPCIVDQYLNPVGAKNGTLQIVISHPNGKETIPVLAQQQRGQWAHETMYELRAKGRYKLDVLLDDVAVQGCPLEWFTKPAGAGRGRDSDRAAAGKNGTSDLGALELDEM